LAGNALTYNKTGGVMELRKMAKASMLAVVLGAASSASASPAPAERCMLKDYSAVSVAAFRTDEDFGLGSYTRLKGAQVYVAAKPGLTAEWLTLSVQRELARLNASPDAACRPAVRDVKVSVTSSGGGFWVFLSAPDERSAASLLRWAQAFVPVQK
jgi:hypothetical protein